MTLKLATQRENSVSANWYLWLSYVGGVGEVIASGQTTHRALEWTPLPAG